MWEFGVHLILSNLFKYFFLKILYYGGEILIKQKIHKYVGDLWEYSVIIPSNPGLVIQTSTPSKYATILGKLGFHAC
jgi:hypothetical protein